MSVEGIESGNLLRSGNLFPMKSAVNRLFDARKHVTATYSTGYVTAEGFDVIACNYLQLRRHSNLVQKVLTGCF